MYFVAKFWDLRMYQRRLFPSVSSQLIFQQAGSRFQHAVLKEHVSVGTNRAARPAGSKRKGLTNLAYLNLSILYCSSQGKSSLLLFLCVPKLLGWGYEKVRIWKSVRTEGREDFDAENLRQ